MQKGIIMGVIRFYDYLTKEDHLQRAIINYYKLIGKGKAFHHSPNEGKRSAFERFKAKYLGLSSGFPDLLFPYQNHGYTMLAMEVKVIYSNGRKNTLSQPQADWLWTLHQSGAYSCVVWTIEDAMDVLNWYFGSKPEPVLPHYGRKWRRLL